jgi:hypothetical protein
MRSELKTLRGPWRILMFFFLGCDLELTIDSVLVRTEGPQLCAGTDICGQRWLAFRALSNEEEWFWLCSPITARALQEVEAGRATPRDAIRHSSTGSAELVSYVGGRARPDARLLCAEIPERFLPPVELRVPSIFESERVAGLEARSRRMVDTVPSRPVLSAA